MSVSNITGGAAGSIVYQTAANTTGFLGATSLVGAYVRVSGSNLDSSRRLPTTTRFFSGTGYYNANVMVRYVIVEIIAGGGGAGGNSGVYGGGGGGSGGYQKFIFVPSGSYFYSIGAGGSGGIGVGAGTANDGVTGGDTTFGSTTVFRGSRGKGASGSTTEALGGTGGSGGTAGPNNVRLISGLSGESRPYFNYVRGVGGNSPFGFAKPGSDTFSQSHYGCGGSSGSGAISGDSGGDGGSGFILITEYYS
jgi:hypothetical protein